ALLFGDHRQRAVRLAPDLLAERAVAEGADRGDQQGEREQRKGEAQQRAAGRRRGEKTGRGRIHERTTAHCAGNACKVGDAVQRAWRTAVQPPAPGRKSAGSTMVRLSITDQCRCGPVTRPVAPTAPIRAPVATTSPAFTSMRLRWQYMLSRPLPWSSHTVWPLKK